MNKKKRTIIYCIATILFALGFLCLAIAAIIQDTMDGKYASIIGLSSFGFWGVALFLLIKNFSKIIISEMNEKFDKMQSDKDFFSMIYLEESPETLEERFVKSGFKLKQEYLHKKYFNFAKDYINYYIAIIKEESIIEYFDVFLKSIEDIFNNASRFHKNNVFFGVLFQT